MKKSSYNQFLESKSVKSTNNGIDIELSKIHPMLFDWQKLITQWAVRKGRCAIWLDTGLGKTFIQLEYARLLGQPTLIIAPLSVAKQTIKEAKKIDLDVKYVRHQSEATEMLNITNYEMIEHFDFSKFGAVVADESSILKALGSKTKQKLISLCKDVPYRLCCTATPAPNDYIELGNHAEFLGICKQSEMLAMFFVNANKEFTTESDGQFRRKKGSNKGGTEWRLKHHAEQPFFKWLSSWAISMTVPSDLGFDDGGFILPPLNVIPQFSRNGYVPKGQFIVHLKGITDRIAVRRDTLSGKLEMLKTLIEENDNDQWIIWCGLDEEQRVIEKLLGNECSSVYGNLDVEEKLSRLERWLDGNVKFLLSKPRICGFGLNLQQAHQMIFFGLNDSWEMYYQAIRREWRYGQSHPVNVYILMHEAENEIYQNVLRKDTMAKRLKQSLIKHIQAYEKGELGMATDDIHPDYQEDTQEGDGWKAMKGDSCQRLKEVKTNSVDLSCYSPPFQDLYVYSSSERDLGNSNGKDQFFEHYAFIIREMLRVTKPGRLSCVHTSDIPALAQKDGYIGVKDFPGAVIKAHEKEGWIFTGRAFIDKNPQAQAIRTKSKGLLFVQMRKDSSDSRPALIDQILLFRKSGDNAVPVRPVENGELNNETWIEWAHGIWLGIRETETLQFQHARGDDDEKHIAPLQLGTIERCIKLYSNPGETVLTPFGGIGSEAYMALKLNRKAILIELKPEYYKVAVKNLQSVQKVSKFQFTL